MTSELEKLKLRQQMPQEPPPTTLTQTNLCGFMANYHKNDPVHIKFYWKVSDLLNASLTKIRVQKREGYDYMRGIEL